MVAVWFSASLGGPGRTEQAAMDTTEMIGLVTGETLEEEHHAEQPLKAETFVNTTPEGARSSTPQPSTPTRPDPDESPSRATGAGATTHSNTSPRNEASRGPRIDHLICTSQRAVVASQGTVVTSAR